MFTTPKVNPLQHNRIYKYVWRPALRRAGLRLRGLYTIRDSFISLSLSAGEDSGWVAQIAGTSEQMIFRHYRRFIRGAVKQDGTLIAALLQRAKNSPQTTRRGPERGPRLPQENESPGVTGALEVEQKGIEPNARGTHGVPNANGRAFRRS